MAALLAYPLVLEPNLGLAQQSTAWAVGYGVFVALSLACATTLWSAGRNETPDTVSSPFRAQDRVSAAEYLRWILLAFIPSSLMLGVTTYMTTDLASIPLLWVIPLALYLLTFILTFARRPILPRSWIVRAFPMAAVIQALVMNISSATQPIFIPFHLIGFFLAAMLCHGELARSRPQREHLTAFYLTISFGGVLGGLFNAVVAPVAFDRVSEYPISFVLACLMLKEEGGRRKEERQRMKDEGGRMKEEHGRMKDEGGRMKEVVIRDEQEQPRTSPDATIKIRSRPVTFDLAAPVLLGAILWGVLALLQQWPDSEQAGRMATVLFGLAAVACYSFKERPVRFAMGIGAVLLAGSTFDTDYGRVLFQHRNYFGVVRVTYEREGNYHRLIHGQTMHGQQARDPGRQREPLTYYFRSGPIGQVFSALGDRIARSNIAIVGLGAGSLACYAQSGQRWTFYEIDPMVVKLARDPRYFTFLRDSRAASTEIILGDARLRLRSAPEHGYGLIVLDAFSSDAIPAHLLTREALKLYLDKLSDIGVLALHISNKHIDLAPVVATLAADAHLRCLIRRDTVISPKEARLGKSTSMWTVMASRENDLADLAKDSNWRPAEARGGEAVWTDDFSSIASHLILFSK
jgi:spermidine synthase